jgi:hypothetical protein
MKYGISILVIICLSVACRLGTSALDAQETNLVSDSVRRMTVNLVHDLSIQGPIAWIKYFDESPDFFMASDGQLAFKDYQSGKLFIENTLIKNIFKIDLQWNQLRIDPLNSNLVSIGGNFHEDLTDTAGKIIQADGYLTAVAKLTNQGWKFRNLHWSILKSK